MATHMSANFIILVDNKIRCFVSVSDSTPPLQPHLINAEGVLRLEDFICGLFIFSPRVWYCFLPLHSGRLIFEELLLSVLH